ncbi:MAG: phage tail assembly protein [Calditrichaceae bacterium]|nr:phage tail assembly protein [Calditrichia bacterium]NUQ41388.1 phage tail assembly protein [Calditrichaceae bacterium]
MAFQTEFEFTLPKGYVDGEGNLHKHGVMRLATAADEILPQKDPRVQQNPAYLVVILLSRVINRLGELSNVTPKTIEGLFSADLAFLQEFYERINGNGSAAIKAVCPKCEHRFEIESAGPGES